MMWQNPSNPVGKILIEASTLNQMDQFRQCHRAAPEAGGVLLGFRRDIHLHVIAQTTPQPADHRSRFHFDRLDGRHQRVALQYWQSSGMKIDYLGEWHTHPEEFPQPSPLDYAEWRKICVPRAYPMLFAILGWSGNLWVGVGKGSVITQSVEVPGHREGALQKA